MSDSAHFIGQEIKVSFITPPVLEKKPGCPDRFIWQDTTFEISRLLDEWHDYHRRCRMAQNMKPTHLATAELRGSWGVGRDYYRVLTDSGRIFELYYDRAPKGSDHRKGAWFLFQELPRPA